MTYNEIIKFRKSLAVGQTKVVGGFTVYRETTMTFHVTHAINRGNGDPESYTEKLIGAGTVQDYIFKEAGRKPHDAGRESDLPEVQRP